MVTKSQTRLSNFTSQWVFTGSVILTVNMRTLPLLQALVLGLSELIVVRWPERVTVMPTSTSQLWEGHSKHLGHRQPEGAHVLPFSLSMWRTKRHTCVYMFKSSKTKQWQSHWKGKFAVTLHLFYGLKTWQGVTYVLMSYKEFLTYQSTKILWQNNFRNSPVSSKVLLRKFLVLLNFAPRSWPGPQEATEG